MVNIKVYLRGKVREEWFMDLANEIRDEFGERGTWTPSEQGFVWTHKRHGGKVRFLRRFDDFDDADFVRISHHSRDRFKQAEAVADFVQWVYHRAKKYVKKVEIQM